MAFGLVDKGWGDWWLADQGLAPTRVSQAQADVLATFEDGWEAGGDGLMGTYTLVVQVNDDAGVTQDEVIERTQDGLSALSGLVTFCGPGALVQSGDVPGEIVSCALEMDGKRVRAQLASTGDGPCLSLYGENCSLEGELPGEYYLVALGKGALGPRA